MRAPWFLLPGLCLASSPLWAIATGCTTGYPVAATPVSATKIDFFYEAPAGSLPPGAIRYSIFEGTSPSSLVQIAITSLPMISVSALPATTYYYLVSAASGGVTISSSLCLATTPPLPNAPSNVTALAQSSSTVLVSWNEQLTNGSLAVVAFRLFRGSSPTTLTLVATVHGVSYLDHVSPGTTYFYAVSALDCEGNNSALGVSTLDVTTN